MNEAMRRFDRKNDMRHLLTRAATIAAGGLWLVIFLILMDASLG